MQHFYGDELASPLDVETNRLIPASVRSFASAAVFVGLVAGMGLWAYRLGTRDAAEVPIIRAMEGPARIQPDDPGGYQAAHQGNEVNRVLEGSTAPIPRKSTPLPTPVALTEEDGPQGELLLASPAPPADDGPAIEAPLPAEGLEPDLVERAPDLVPADLAALAMQAGEDEAPEAAAAGPRPRVRPANLARAKLPSAKPATKPAATETAAAPAASAPAAAPAAREVSSVSKGSRLVQLGAFDSEAITRQAWSRLVAKNPDLLGSKSLYVERATGSARVFYRLRVAGFQNTDQTRDMCEALRARGVDCIPVTLN
jgi:cell division septation protein DedD